MRRAAGMALAALAWGAEAAWAESSAVVVAYQMFGEGPATVEMDEFRAHLKELAAGPYAVLPLSRVVDALRAGAPLPDRAVAITVDGAHRSFYRLAWPLLKQAGLPVTVFVPTERLGERGYNALTWEELREIAASGAEIGLMGTGALRYLGADETRLAADIAGSLARAKQELGKAPDIFAYPAGEFDRAARRAVRKAGFAAAFGLHSGVAHAGADRFALPRFLLVPPYSAADRFRLAVNALPLPVADLLPAEPVLTANPPAIGFTVDASVGALDGLSCFASEAGKAKVEVLGPRVEVRLKEKLPPGRARLNCTLPGPEGRWRWLGIPLFVPR